MTLTNARKIWDDYGTDRGYILKMLGFSPFHCDAYGHCDWPSLPKTVREKIAHSDSPAKPGRSKAAKARKSLTADQLFFYWHTGYSYDSKTETADQGRIRCAVELADAEATAQRLGYEYEWECDPDPDLSWMDDEERQQEHEVLCCRIVDPQNRRYSLASLCGITDPDSEYRRVIKAELAQEAIAELDREIETLDAH